MEELNKKIMEDIKSHTNEIANLIKEGIQNGLVVSFSQEKREEGELMYYVLKPDFLVRIV